MRDATRRALPTLLLALACGHASPGTAEATAPDAALEARVVSVAEELRCVVCQNETIAASQAELAVDLRQQIRRRLQQGESPEQITQFMVQRYGEFVRYRPAFNTLTLPLWLGPFALLAFATLALVRHLRERPRDAAPDANAASRETPLSGPELERVKGLLQEGGGPP